MRSDNDSEDFSSGNEIGRADGRYHLAQQMRVLVCALVTAHKRDDSNAFWATVEIIKVTLGNEATFSDSDWAIFRGDAKSALGSEA